MKNPTAQTKKGFTLIELMVAVSIAAVTFGIIISSAVNARKSARDAQRQSDLRSLQAALQQFYADQNYFPDAMTLTSATTLNQCTTSYTGCLSAKIYLNPTPIDPTGTPAYVYKSGLDSGSGKNTSCPGGGPTRTCHYYLLCAKLEGTSPQTSTQYDGCTTNFGGSGYNFQINP